MLSPELELELIQTLKPTLPYLHLLLAESRNQKASTEMSQQLGWWGWR